jgi:IS5 family transposase
MLDRHIARAGAPPRQTAADGGYASRANLAAAKARGVADVAFHKKAGIAVGDMVKSPWVYRRLRNFRAGIEAGISCLKRAHMAPHAALGVDSTTSRPRPWWPTIWCCSPASNWHSRFRFARCQRPPDQPGRDCS